MANSYREYLKMKKYGGEGGDTPSPTLISKTINANGLYLPEDDQADGYNSVSVNVPEVSDIAFVPPQKFKSNGSNLEDYKIFGSDGVVTETETSVLPLTFTTTEDKLRDWEIFGNNESYQMLPDSTGQQVITCDAGTTVSTGITGLISLDAGRYTIHYYQMTSMTSNTRNTLSILSNATSAQTYENGSPNHNLNAGWYSWTFDISITGNYQLRIWINNPSDETKATNFILTKGETTAPDHYIPYQQGVGERTANIFNENANDTNNGYVNPGRLSHNGNVITTPIANANVFVSEYIEIEESKDYTISDCYLTTSYGGCFYNSEKTYISGFTYNNVNHGNKTVTSPANAKYIRISAATYIGDEHYKMMVTKGSTAPSTYVPFGYEIPISVNGTPQTFYIGDSPLTAGQSISKTSTGVDISTTEGENTISTTLYNKPETSVTYAESGVGEEVSGSYVIPVKINSTTTNVPIGDTPLMEDEYVSYAEQKIYRYVDGTLTPVDPPSALPQIATANGVNDLSVETDIQPELVQIGLGIPVELIPTALGTKNITANDTYDASDDSLDGYSSVTVNVPEKVLTTKTITASGTYNAVDDQADGYSSVTVNVSSYNETWVNRIDFVITEVTS